MASLTQIVPEHDYAHVMTVIHDNSARPTDSLGAAETTYCNMMYVFSSPKGIDRELQTVSGGMNEFVERYGIGSFDTYGQAFLNAYAAASTNAATLHCLRVTAEDAAYAVGALIAHYKVTPGTPAVEPTPTPSDKVNVRGHANVIASDSVDEATGATIITVAGTNVEPGISAELAETFGAVSGEYIDITIDLAKIMTLDPAKTYQITQVNPALAEYVGRDEFVSNVDGVYKKVKTYTGALLQEGYDILVGAQTTATLSIVEWGAAAPEVIIVNNTDLGVAIADPKAKAVVTASGSEFVVACSGDAVAGVINADLWGAISGNHIEVDLIFPGLEAEKTYRVINTNANLETHSGDPSISQVDGVWKKSKEYKGADMLDGFACLMGEGKGDAIVRIYDAATFVSEADSDFIMSATIVNGFNFVASHPVEPATGPVGEPVNVTVNSSMSFTTTTTKSALLRATAASRSVMRAITPAAEGGTPGSMEIFYTFESVEGVTDLENLGNLVSVDATPDANGFTAVKVFEIAARGRGAWGNNIRFVLDSYARGDRLSSYKNYIMSIYEISKATMVKKEEFTIAFSPDAVNADGQTLFADFIVGDPYEDSSYISIISNPAALTEMFAAYVSVFPDTSLTEKTFDPITGLMFGTTLSGIEGVTIDMTSNGTVSVNGASGIALMNGSDGAFDVSNPDRQAAMNDAYLKAYSGEIDRNVRSRKLFPTDIIFDANFATETKIAIHELVSERQDCMGMFDVGTEMNTYAGMMASLADIEPYITSRSETIEAYKGKIQDPATFKIVPVTSTYALSLMYPRHFQQNGAKHVPLAGSAYGVMSGFISGSAWPVFDDDLDSKILDELTELKVNFLKVNTKKQVVRGAQTTRQEVDTNLSEASNVFVLLDIRRDAVQLCEQYEYNFAEASDLQRFNKAAKILAEKYQDAQVKSISAEFSMNDWETERGILHLYIDFVHKNIIKRSIVEISVNRGTVEV